jgi:FAD/FMN-containing dehydrogenase
MSIDGVWLPGESDALAASDTAWARRFFDALRPHDAGGVYVNFLDADDGAGRVRAAYGDHTYRRLAAVKARYDPDNVFHLNKNIAPA